MKHKPFCPVASREIMDVLLNRFRESGIFPADSLKEMHRSLESLKEVLSERYFPDVFFDLSLIEEKYEGMAAVFDCYDRCFVNTASEGEYFRRIHTDVRCTPKDRGRLLILKADTAGVSAVFEEIVFHPISSFADLPEVLRELSGLRTLTLQELNQIKSNGNSSKKFNLDFVFICSTA